MRLFTAALAGRGAAATEGLCDDRDGACTAGPVLVRLLPAQLPVEVAEVAATASGSSSPPVDLRLRDVWVTAVGGCLAVAALALDAGDLPRGAAAGAERCGAAFPRRARAGRADSSSCACTSWAISSASTCEYACLAAMIASNRDMTPASSCCWAPCNATSSMASITAVGGKHTQRVNTPQACK
jgi:hypothetical protein